MKTFRKKWLRLKWWFVKRQLVEGVTYPNPTVLIDIKEQLSLENPRLERNAHQENELKQLLKNVGKIELIDDILNNKYAR